MPRQWNQTNTRRWDSDDGACVKYDYSTQFTTAREWLPNHRGYVAFGPNCEYPLTFTKYRPKHIIHFMEITRKFKTPENAMKVIDCEFPHGV